MPVIICIEINLIEFTVQDTIWMRSQPRSQPNPALSSHSFFHPPGWSCLCAVEADHLLPAQGANRRRVSVCLCVCACLSINNNLHSNNNLFYPFPISHPFRSSVWLEVRSEVLGGQGFYSLFPPQSAPRVWDGLAELGSCQELAWQLPWTRERKERNYPPGLVLRLDKNRLLSKKIQIQYQITLSKPPELIGVILYPHSYSVYSISPLPSPLEIVACHVLNPVIGLTHPLFLGFLSGIIPNHHHY